MIDVEVTFQEVIIKGEVCGYCGQPTTVCDSKVIYGKSYGMIHYCYPCGAYVGCHKGTSNALGRVANHRLREWKKLAHLAFDPLWRHKLIVGIGSRKDYYTWLSEQLCIPVKFTNMGMFTEEICDLVVKACLPILLEHKVKPEIFLILKALGELG